MQLGDLTNLQILSSTAIELSGEIPEELGDLASLQILYLNDNELSGPIPVVGGPDQPPEGCISTRMS